MNPQSSQMTLPPQNIPQTLFGGKKPQGVINPQPSQTTLPPTTLVGGNKPQAIPASGRLFTNLQPSPLVANIPTNQPSGLQSQTLFFR